MPHRALGLTMAKKGQRDMASRMRLGLLLLVICAPPARAEGPWSGEWDTRWRAGGAHMSLTQNGSDVICTYPLYDGRIDARAAGGALGGGILAIDRPFTRGDWIVADAVRGTVEHVGIRSTRVRTAEDTVTVIPNGKLADAAINNWGTRRHRLSATKLLIGYGCTPRQLDDFIAGLKQILRATPEVVEDRTQIGVTSLTERGIELDVTFYLNASSATDERRVNNAVFLEMLALADSLQLRLGLGPSIIGDPV